MPELGLLKKVRQEIDYDFKGFKEIVDNKSFRKLFPKLNGEALSRPPQGYDVNNPAIEFLKMKSLTAGHPMKDEDLTSGKAIKNVVGVFTTLSPLINFLNRAQED
jgi:uncharacterized protein (DUF2461 family)